MKFLTLAIILMSCLVAINAQCAVQISGSLLSCRNDSCQGYCVLQTTTTANGMSYSCTCSGGIGKRDFETYFSEKIANKRNLAK